MESPGCPQHLPGVQEGWKWGNLGEKEDEEGESWAWRYSGGIHCEPAAVSPAER